MVKKGAALFILLLFALLQVTFPLITKIPCQMATLPIAFFWLIFGRRPALSAAFFAGFALDILSFATPFGLFLISYTVATLCATRINRFFLQNFYLTYLLFAATVSFLAPLLQAAFMALTRGQFRADHLVWNVLVPATIDFVTAAFLGLPLLYLLSKKRPLHK